jgi:hypothetical protein
MAGQNIKLAFPLQGLILKSIAKRCVSKDGVVGLAILRDASCGRSSG